MIARLGRPRSVLGRRQGRTPPNRRVRFEGALALALAIAACGLTAAMWLRQVLPVLGVRSEPIRRRAEPDDLRDPALAASSVRDHTANIAPRTTHR